jgi:hypothetical protein
VIRRIVIWTACIYATFLVASVGLAFLFFYAFALGLLSAWGVVEGHVS